MTQINQKINNMFQTVSLDAGSPSLLFEVHWKIALNLSLSLELSWTKAPLFTLNLEGYPDIFIVWVEMKFFIQMALFSYAVFLHMQGVFDLTARF